MDERKFAIWVNWERKVITFRPEEGFEELRYHTREEMLRFAMKRIKEAFAIQ